MPRKKKQRIVQVPNEMVGQELDALLAELIGETDRNRILTALNSLSAEERLAVEHILDEHIKTGNSQTLFELTSIDYDTQPATVEEFLQDPYYLGNVLGGGALYPRWLYHMKNFLDPNAGIIEVCFTGDTEVVLADGTARTMKSLAEDGKDFFVYSMDLKNKRPKICRAHTAMKTRENAEVWKLTLDDGSVIRATPDHGFYLRDGTKIKLRDLKPGDSLLSVRFREEKMTGKNGKYKGNTYTQIFNPFDGKWNWSHKLADEHNLRHSKYQSKKFDVRHHVDLNRYNNNPDNIIRMQFWDHLRLHSALQKERWKNPEFRKKMIEVLRANGVKSWKTRSQESIDKFRSQQKEWVNSPRGKGVSVENLNIFNDKVKNGDAEALDIVKQNSKKGTDLLYNSQEEKYVNAREVRTEKIRKHMLESGQAQKMAEYWKSDRSAEDREKMAERTRERNKTHPNRRDDITRELVDKILTDNGQMSLVKLAEKLNCSKSGLCGKMIKMGIDKPYDYTKNFNHKVVSLEFDGYEDVYNFTADEEHNYTLKAGSLMVTNCATGGIGLGKSTIAVASMLYHMHKLLCLRNPQQYYNLTPGSMMMFAVFNLTLKLSEDVGFNKLKTMIDTSPFFSERRKPTRAESQILFPKNVGIVVGSRATHVLGQDTFAGLVDEANFFQTGDDPAKSQVMKTYNALYRRMESRYMQKGGRIPGQLFIVSSKNDKSSFLELHIEKNKSNPKTYVIDEPVWMFKEHLGLYTGETFKVMIGNQYRDSKILHPDDAVPEGFEVIDVPSVYRDSFTRDLDISIRDIAGKSTFSDINLIKNRTYLRECFIKEIKGKPWTSPFTTHPVQLDFDDKAQSIFDFMDMQKFEQYLTLVGYNHPRAIHIDVGIVNDALGLAMVYNSDNRLVDETSIDGMTITKLKQSFRVDFNLRAVPVPGKEMPLRKIVEFVKDLRDRIGINIVKVTTDGYQSTQLRQDFRTFGFGSEELSVDRTDKPYIILKEAILDRRIEFYEDANLLTELTDLIHDPSARKVDHPLKASDGGKGRKDVADGVCGALTTLVMEEEYFLQRRPSALSQQDLMDSLTEDDEMEDDFASERRESFVPTVISDSDAEIIERFKQRRLSRGKDA